MIPASTSNAMNSFPTSSVKRPYPGLDHLALFPSLLSVSFIPTDGSAPLPLLTHGEPEKVDEKRAKEILKEEDLEVRVEVGLGKESARYWTCDFSYVSWLIFFGRDTRNN